MSSYTGISGAEASPAFVARCVFEFAGRVEEEQWRRNHWGCEDKRAALQRTTVQ